jgi:hypothetical protein
VSISQYRYVERIKSQHLYPLTSRDLKLSHLSIHAPEPNPFFRESIDYSHFNTSSSRYFHTAQHPTYPLNQSHQSHTNPQMAKTFVIITCACRRAGISYLAYLYIKFQDIALSTHRASLHALITPEILHRITTQSWNYLKLWPRRHNLGISATMERSIQHSKSQFWEIVSWIVSHLIKQDTGPSPVSWIEVGVYMRQE